MRPLKAIYRILFMCYLSKLETSQPSLLQRAPLGSHMKSQGPASKWSRLRVSVNVPHKKRRRQGEAQHCIVKECALCFDLPGDRSLSEDFCVAPRSRSERRQRALHGDFSE